MKSIQFFRSSICRVVALAIVAFVASSCGSYVEKAVEFETVEKVSYAQGTDFQFDLRVRNDLTFPVAIKSGTVTLYFRQQALATLTLQKPAAAEPIGVQTVETIWRLNGDTAAVMSKLGRHAMIHKGNEELFVGYSIKVAAKGMTKTLEDQNIPVQAFSFNFQNLF